MKTLKLISVFVFLTIVKANSQNLNTASNKVVFIQTRNQLNNTNFDNAPQQMMPENNVDFNNVSQVPDNSIDRNEQKQEIQVNFSRQKENKSTEIKPAFSLKTNSHSSPKVYHAKKKIVMSNTCYLKPPGKWTAFLRNR